MSGKPGKSGGARRGSGRPTGRKTEPKIFHLSPEAHALISAVPKGKQSATVDRLIKRWGKYA